MVVVAEGEVLRTVQEWLKVEVRLLHVHVHAHVCIHVICIVQCACTFTCILNKCTMYATPTMIVLINSTWASSMTITMEPFSNGADI